MCVRREVLPSMYKFVGRAARDSYRKDVGSSYRASAAFGAQARALAALAQLAPALRLRGRALRLALRAALPYLSDKQPRPLQVPLSYMLALLVHPLGHKT